MLLLFKITICKLLIWNIFRYIRWPCLNYQFWLKKLNIFFSENYILSLQLIILSTLIVQIHIIGKFKIIDHVTGHSSYFQVEGQEFFQLFPGSGKRTPFPMKNILKWCKIPKILILTLLFWLPIYLSNLECKR